MGGNMKISVEKKDLLNMIARAQTIVEKRNTMPVLVNILLETQDNKLCGFATDLEVSLADQIPARVEEPGRVAVNVKNLFEIIKELPDGRAELARKENNWLKITQNRSVFNIVGISPDEYPVFPTVATNDLVTLDAEVLADMIEKTIYAVSADEARYHLNGVYLEMRQVQESTVCRMVATDGHRLSLIDRKVPESLTRNGNHGVIIPRKGLHEIRKLLETVDKSVEVAIEGAQWVVRHGTTVLMVRLIEGKYPNYQQLIPQNLKEHFLVQRESLLSALKRVSLLSNSKSKGVTFSLTKGRLDITSNNPELGDAKEELEVDYKGKDVKIGYNARYLLDLLSCMKDDVVRVNFNDQLSPAIVHPHQDNSYTCVVMPMRI